MFILFANRLANQSGNSKLTAVSVKNYKERSGFWASPVVFKDRVYIGSNNGYMYCLTADKGEVVWKHLVRAPIWGTAPVIDGRLVFGDKARWIYMLSVGDGQRMGELKIGDNVNSTPAVLEGRIYIGALNGNLYCLGTKRQGGQEAAGLTK
jgi:outer membrane protein assembly factor BamB